MAWAELAIALRRSGVSPDRPPWAGLSDDALSPSERGAVLSAIIADLDEHGNAAAIVRFLSTESNADARRLALEIASRLPKMDPVSLAWLRPLLRDRRMPPNVLIEGAAGLLRTASGMPKVAAQILRDFAAGFGRKRVLKRQRSLRGRLGSSRAFDRLCAELKRTIPLRCPQCGVRRRPESMERHLWRRHHRLLVDGRVRSPLRWLDQLSSLRAVDRDADSALDAVTRYITNRQLKSEDALLARQAIAGRRSASNCPHCWAIVPRKPDAEPIRPLAMSRGRLSGEGWIVERITHGIGNAIRIRPPGGGEISLAESAAQWSQTSAIRWLVLPWVVLALVLAAAMPAPWAILGTAIALTGAYAWRLAVRAFAAPPNADALIDAAWMQIVQPGLDRDVIPWTFAARLAATSANLGSARIRHRVVRSLVDRSQIAAVGIAERAALLGLFVRDAGVLEDDPLPPLLDAISNVLIHDRPIDEIERIVESTPWHEWSAARRARLRIALTERAFSAGLGVWELMELGTMMPGFGEWISADDLDRVAMLRGLWLLRSDRGWEACGPAATVFELAAYPVHEETFGAAPDLLLDAPLATFGEHVWLRGRGLSFRGATIRRPEPIEIQTLPMDQGYEVHFGTHRFQYDDDPSDLAQALREWSQYHFGTLLPARDGAVGQPDGASLEQLLQSKTMVCPECSGMFRIGSTVATNDSAG